MAAACATAPLRAQLPDEPPASRAAYWWSGAALIAAAAAADAGIEHASLEHRSTALHRLERAGNALGSGRVLVPALAAGWVTGRLARRPAIANAAVAAALAYVAGNALVDIGKPAFGRHRPDTTGSPWRFHPFDAGGEWHSLPSAHTLHAFTIAGALASFAGRPWLTGAAYGGAAVVGWSRLYADEHWASDVALSAVVGAAIGQESVAFLRRRGRDGAPSRVTVAPAGNGVALRVAW